MDRADEAGPDHGGADVGDPGHQHLTMVGRARRSGSGLSRRSRALRDGIAVARLRHGDVASAGSNGHHRTLACQVQKSPHAHDAAYQWP